MNYDIYCPNNLYYYINEDIVIRTINNTSDKYIWGYSYPQHKMILLIPPYSKRKYMFSKSTKKIILKYDNISYIINLSYNNIYTIP